MSKETKNLLSKIDMHLEEISSKLSTLISLTKLGQRQAIQLMMKSLSKFEQDVYSLCDGTKTVSDISKILGRSIQQISMCLSKMEEEGLVVSTRKGKHKYYERVI